MLVTIHVNLRSVLRGRCPIVQRHKTSVGSTTVEDFGLTA
jgi:hypothetical protein